MGPTMQMTATPRRNAGQEIAQWARPATWVLQLGAGDVIYQSTAMSSVTAVPERRRLAAGCWLAGSAPSKSSAQVDGAAPPPAMMISPGWAGSRGRDRDRRSAGGGENWLPVSMPCHVCHVAEGGAQRVPAGSAAAIAPASRVQFFCALRCASRDDAKFPSNSLLLSEAAIAPASLPVLFARSLSSPL
jgi:hypothetical protein